MRRIVLALPVWALACSEPPPPVTTAAADTVAETVFADAAIDAPAKPDGAADATSELPPDVPTGTPVDAAPEAVTDAIADAPADIPPEATAADATPDFADLLDPPDLAAEVDTALPQFVAGCSDGSREGFNDAKFPTLAACNGAWDQPGIFDMAAKCNREAGNDGKNKDGKGCTVSDLCAVGWHVCYGKQDVLNRNPDGCKGVMQGAKSPVFFTTQMSSTGAFLCDTKKDATNDLFGCGDLGCDFTSNAVVKEKCYPLVMSSHDLCKGLRNDLGVGDWCNHLGKYPGLPNSWECGKDPTKEALNVTKTHPEQQGGVLCCQD
jgi:hypothetical protein